MSYTSRTTRGHKTPESNKSDGVFDALDIELHRLRIDLAAVNMKMACYHLRLADAHSLHLLVSHVSLMP
jgi:hypothetical protein